MPEDDSGDNDEEVSDDEDDDEADNEYMSDTDDDVDGELIWGLLVTWKLLSSINTLLVL